MISGWRRVQLVSATRTIVKNQNEPHFDLSQILNDNPWRVGRMRARRSAMPLH
jgi:hypothetical protein